MPKPAVSLLSLPDELLDIILCHFLADPYSEERLWALTLSLHEPAELVRHATSSSRPNYGRYSLRSLSSVCRRLHYLATPWLYHTFPTSTAMWYPVTSRIPLRTCQFLVTLLLNPDLIRHVKRIVLHPLAATWWAHESPFFPSQPPEYASLLRRLESKLQVGMKLGRPEDASGRLAGIFHDRLRSASNLDGFLLSEVADDAAEFSSCHGSIEAQLLLSLATHLETLIWSDWRTEDKPNVAGMLQLVHRKHLNTLIIDYTYDLGTLEKCGRISRLRPALASITCGCASVDPLSALVIDRYWEIERFHSSSLTRTQSITPMSSLRLTSACSTGLRTLLAPLPGLRSLHIKLTVDFGMRDIRQSWGRVSGSWTDVLADISENALLLDTLEALVLDSTIKGPDEDLMTTDNWPVHASSLHGFKRLMSLEVHQSAFISFTSDSSFPKCRRPIAEVVPQTLTRLRILCFDAGLLGQMDDFVRDLPGGYSMLKQLEVQAGDFCCFDVNRAYPPHNLVRSSEDHIEALYGRCADKNIEFVELA